MILRLPGLVGALFLRAIISRSFASLASRAAFTCRAAFSRVSRRLRSSSKSCCQRIRSTSASNTLILRPTSRVSKVGSSISMSAMLGASKVSLWASMRASMASTSLSCRSRVRVKDETALSMRFSTLTRKRCIRLSSRSFWRKKPSPPRTWVLYFSSYSACLCGRT